jgi:hypothetical protein
MSEIRLDGEPLQRSDYLLDKLSKSELKRCCSDVIKAKMGIRHYGDQHPATVELLKLHNRSNLMGGFQQRGLTTSDIAEFTAAAFEVLAQEAPKAPHRKLLKFIQAENYLVHELAFSIKQPVLEKIPEAGEFPETRYSQNSTINARVKKHGASLLVSKEALKNNPEQLGVLPEQLLQSAYSTEVDELLTVLAANANLIDGLPLFATGNTGTGTTLDSALAIWRIENNEIDPAHVILPPSKELAFRSAAWLAGLSLNFFVHKDATKVYLLADQKVRPALVLLALDETPAVDTITRLPLEMNAGMMLRVEDSFTVVPVSRAIIAMTLE